MKNFIVRTIVGIIFVWLLLEGTASENVWYYILWGAVGLLSLWEFFSLLLSRPMRNKVLWGVIGALYIALSIYLIIELKPHWMLVVMMLTMTWGNDVGAYLVGVTMGKHKMAPKISPKKSWEGFFGGLIFAAAVSVGWYYFNPLKLGTFAGVFDMVPLWQWCAVGIVVGLGAVIGDLVESYFKRVIGVKDSGKMIPAHGGMLDRFDALFMVTPLFYLCALLLNMI